MRQVHKQWKNEKKLAVPGYLRLDIKMVVIHCYFELENWKALKFGMNNCSYEISHE